MIKVKSFSQQNKKKHEANTVDLIFPAPRYPFTVVVSSTPPQNDTAKEGKESEKKIFDMTGKIRKMKQIEPGWYCAIFRRAGVFFFFSFLKYSWSRLKKEFSAIMLWCDWKVMSSSGVNKMGGFSPVVVVIGGEKTNKVGRFPLRLFLSRLFGLAFLRN